MEMQRSLLLMYASCAWFFDDIAGPEAAIAMRRAAHAMDLWKVLGGKPPEKAFVQILAHGRSNDPKLGSGADAFARACKDRVTPESAVARAAFSCLAAMAPGKATSPGFDVKTNCPATQSTRQEIQGMAEVTNRRTGESKTLKFSATHDGKSGFLCHTGGRRLGLDNLDEEAAQALRLGALVRMADGAREAAGCRAFLAVADKLGTCTSSERSALAGLFTRVLATYLERGFRDERIGKSRQPGGGVDWSLALKLADRAGTAQASDDWRRVQEIVWEHLEAKRRQGEPPSVVLHELALRLELVKPVGAEVTADTTDK
jgi:hypothetical protein